MTDLRNRVKNHSSILALAGITMLAFVVRMLGPLQESALGQTDAYAHLQFLNDILTTGRLRHPLYPSGYYWILAVPARVFQLDAYHVVRYAGAFFGCAMVMALYALSRPAFGRRAALWAAFLAAAFPAFHWLQKTGIGAYPSQLGLVLTPLILLLWDRVLCGRYRAIPWLLTAAALLACSVPMMLLDVLPFLFLDFCVRAGRREVSRSAWLVLGGAAAFLVGGLTLLALRGGLDGLVETACSIAQLKRPDGNPATALLRVFGAYVAAQQGLPKNFILASAALAVGALLAGVLAIQWKQGSTARMIALWAFFVWVQTVFGHFQFGLYMRAGWPLLMALAIVGGWVVQTVFDRIPPGMSRVGSGLLLASAGISLVYPPMHHPHLSAAESDLVFAARQLVDWTEGRRLHADFAWLEAFDDAPTLTVWSRRYRGWYQGDPLQALLENNDRITLHSLVESQARKAFFDPTLPHMVLLDDQAPINDRFGLMHVVNADLIAALKRRRGKLLPAATVLRQQVDLAEAEGWIITRRRLPHGLDVKTLEHPDPAQPRGETSVGL